MPFIENFEEFKTRQACASIRVKNDDYQEVWLFANGAACEMQKLGFNRTLSVREAPQEKWALLRAKREFVLAKIERESQAYQAALADCQQRANWAVQFPDSCPAVPKTVLNELRDWWDTREKLRAELEQLDQQLAESPEALQARQQSQLAERDTAIRAERKHTATLLNSISSTSPPPTRDIVEEVGNYLNQS